jgi:site-specific DNA-methyltransferase (adenine-specific)
MVISESNLLNKGISEYQEKSEKELALLQNIHAFPVQRNKGIDGFLKEHYNGMPVPVKIQSDFETLEEAIEKLEKATLGKGYPMKILIQTKEAVINPLFRFDASINIIKSLELQTKELLNHAHETRTTASSKVGFLAS